MKRIISFISLLLCSVIIFGSLCFAEGSADSMKIVSSADGTYKYIIDEETGELLYVGSNEADITILNIPESIDGKKVSGIEGCELNTGCLVKINYPPTAETVYSELPFLLSKKKANVPLCNINLSKGFQIGGDSHPYYNYLLTYYFGLNSPLPRNYDVHYIKTELLLLIVPDSITKINIRAIELPDAKNIVIQGNPDAFSKPIDSLSPYDDEYNTKVFFANDSTKFDSTAFNIFILDGAVNDLYIQEPYGHEITNPHVAIYKKPGAEGFEKFEEAGYTVKEYTDEWWKDIKEIQSVEISGKGVTEKKNSQAKGTVTELGWSPSNDPAQYLSREYELSAKPGDSITLKSSFAPADAFDDRTFFVSLNEDVATVDTESGKVTVLKEGTATIRCVAASGVFSDCFIYSGSVAQTQAKTQAKSDSLKAKTPLIIISCSCAAILAAGVVVFTVKKKRRKV